MSEIPFPSSIMKKFVETLSTELGHDTFTAMLSKAGLPEEWSRAAHFSALNEPRTGQAYSQLQLALRTYYGRGAMRIQDHHWRFVT